MFARVNCTTGRRFSFTKCSRRTTDGSLNENETDRTSRSYVSTTSTFPWTQSVTARCQSTTFRGSYDALRTSVLSIVVYLSVLVEAARIELARCPDPKSGDSPFVHARSEE